MQQNKSYILACGALANEIQALIHSNGLTHLVLDCLPAILHNHPEKIASALDIKLQEAAKHYKYLYIGYADCGSGGEIEKISNKYNAQMLHSPHCYAFYAGTAIFLEHTQTEFDAFYLTDFLAEHFDNFVTKPLGLDKYPQLRDDYFKHYKKLIYLAQTENVQLQQKAKNAANFLKLDYVYKYTGYGELEQFLKITE